MLQLPISDIGEYVKARLDELSNNEDALLVTGDDTVADLDSVVRAVAVPSVRAVELAAPNVLIKGADTLSLTTSFTQRNGRHVCRASLPDDFMRLVSLRMSDWARPIQTLFGEDSTEYARQGNPYLMGTPSRPVGFVVHAGANGSVELYSCSSATATVATASYLKEPSLAGSGSSVYVSVADPLRYACLDMATAAVMRSFGMHQQAAVYEAAVADALSVTPDILRKSSQTGERVNPSMNR